MPIKAIKDNIKAITDIAEKTKNLDLKENIISLREQVQELREENLELKGLLSVQTNSKTYNMVFKKTHYENILDDDSVEGTYCQVCWDNNNKAIRVEEYEGEYNCRVCHNVF